VSFDDHRRLLKCGQRPRSVPLPHFLRLAELLFEKLTFANILGHHRRLASCVFQFVRNSFD